MKAEQLKKYDVVSVLSLRVSDFEGDLTTVCVGSRLLWNA